MFNSFVGYTAELRVLVHDFESKELLGPPQNEEENFFWFLGFL